MHELHYFYYKFNMISFTFVIKLDIVNVYIYFFSTFNIYIKRKSIADHLNFAIVLKNIV